jgi:thiamine-monophosphate kinase
MADEFSLIERYFTWANPPKSVTQSVGDDAAILNLPQKQQQLVVSVDTLISGVHFPKDTAPHAIAYKALAVNLSDLAAMGAEPAWFTLSLTLPDIDNEWLREFSEGLKSLAEQHNIFLVGGDTCRGALSISIQVMGFVDTDKALLRSTAQHGDKIYVTGTLGDAAAGLAVLQNNLFLEPQDAAECVSQLEYPQPRNAISRLLRGFASSCIDLSDGLLADLQHILDASKMGAHINTHTIPLSPILKKLHHDKALELALTGGDDYELLFTLSPLKAYQLKPLIRSRKLVMRCIGTIDQSIKHIELQPNIKFPTQGYQHFS